MVEKWVVLMATLWMYVSLNFRPVQHKFKKILSFLLAIVPLALFPPMQKGQLTFPLTQDQLVVDLGFPSWDNELPSRANDGEYLKNWGTFVFPPVADYYSLPVSHWISLHFVTWIHVTYWETGILGDVWHTGGLRRMV